MTRCGTCVPPGPSKNTAGWPFTVCDSAGNWLRIQARSSAGMTASFRSENPMYTDGLDAARIVLLRTYAVALFRTFRLRQQGTYHPFVCGFPRGTRKNRTRLKMKYRSAAG